MTETVSWGCGHGADAHRARLEGDHQRQPGQPPGAEGMGHLPDRDDLRVRGGITGPAPCGCGRAMFSARSTTWPNLSRSAMCATASSGVEIEAGRNRAEFHLVETRVGEDGQITGREHPRRWTGIFCPTNVRVITVHKRCSRPLFATYAAQQRGPVRAP